MLVIDYHMQLISLSNKKIFLFPIQVSIISALWAHDVFLCNSLSWAGPNQYEGVINAYDHSVDQLDDQAYLNML